MLKISAVAVCVFFLVSVAGTLVYAQHGSAGQHLQGNPPGTYRGPFIQVRLSVQNKICDSLSPPYNASYFLDYVFEGSSLFKVMTMAEPLGFTFNYTVHPIYGAYITTVNGVYADDSLHQFWAILDGWTGALLQLGASSYQPINGQNILFKLSLY